jgi:surface protein
MKSMFDGCNKVTKLDLSNFNTSQVSDMSSMFQNCASLKELNISSWDTNNVINMA